MATTAEGAKTAEQLERVKSEGCTEVQGFLFGAPRRAAGSTPKFCGADATACRPSPALLDRETDGEALNKHRNAPRTDASAAANRVAAIFDASFR